MRSRNRSRRKNRARSIKSRRNLRRLARSRGFTRAPNQETSSNKTNDGRKGLSNPLQKSNKTVQKSQTNVSDSKPVSSSTTRKTGIDNGRQETHQEPEKVVQNPTPNIDVDASDVSTVMDNQGKHDKHVELAKKVAAGAAVGGAGYLIYKNVANRVAKRNVKDKAAAEALHKEEREKVVKAEKSNVEKASKKLTQDASLKDRQKYLQALEKEQKELMSQNKELAKTSVYGELNTEGKEGLKQVSALKGTDAKVLSDNIAKEQLEKSQANIDKIAKELGMEKDKGGWKKAENFTEQLDDSAIQRIKATQAQNSAELTNFDIGKSDTYNEYKAVANDADPANKKTAQEIVDENNARKVEGGVDKAPTQETAIESNASSDVTGAVDAASTEDIASESGDKAFNKILTVDGSQEVGTLGEKELERVVVTGLEDVPI